MIQVKITNPEGRNTVMADENKTILDFLSEQDEVLEGASVSLDGITLTRTELTQSFSANFVEESCRLTITVKSDNGVA